MNRWRWLLAVWLICAPLCQGQESVIIAFGDYAPYVSSQDGGSGAVLDIIRQAFAVQGIEVSYQFLPWNRCERMVTEGKAFATAPYFKTDERLRLYDFSDPLLFSFKRFFYDTERFPGGFIWETFEDFRGYRMGGVLGYWYLPAFERAKLIVETVTSEEQNMAKLIARRIDFILLDELVGMCLLQERFPDSMESIGVLKKAESFDEMYLLISKTYPEVEALTKQFNAGLKRLKENGEYRKILETHQIPKYYMVP